MFILFLCLVFVFNSLLNTTNIAIYYLFIFYIERQIPLNHIRSHKSQRVTLRPPLVLRIQR